MERTIYRFTASGKHHKDVIDFLDEFPRAIRGKIIIEALREYAKKLMPSESNVNATPERKIDIGKLLGKRM